MQVIRIILMLGLIVCAISVSAVRNLLASVVIYMTYSLVMAIIWILLQSTDLAVTEAAVGAGITTLLFFVTLKQLEKINGSKNDGEDSK